MRTRWTGTPARTILPCKTTPAPRCPTCGSLLTRDTHETHSLLAPGERLTPWMIHDLPRIAWIVEYRAAELTDEERHLVRDATTRMLGALEHETGLAGSRERGAAAGFGVRGSRAAGFLP
jgi:hypothetical protein